MFSAKQLARLDRVSRNTYRIILRKTGPSPQQHRCYASEVIVYERPKRVPWTQQDLAELHELRVKGDMWKDIAAAFPGRTLAACRERYNKIYGTSSRLVRWNKEDLERLMELKERGGSWKSIAAEFNGRSPCSVQAAYIRFTGVKEKRRLWTDEEVALLHSMRQRREPWRKVLAAFPGRTMLAVFACYTRTKSSTLHVLDRSRWTEEESARLLQMRAIGESWSKIVASGSFPGRTISSLQSRYVSIGPRGKYGRLVYGGQSVFTNAERDEIHRLHEQGKSRQEIHAIVCPDKPFSKMKSAIKAGRRGDEIQNSTRFRTRWTRAEDKAILSMRQREFKSFKEIAQVIGRSYISTNNRYYRLTEGTIKPRIPMPRQYTPEDNAKIARMVKAKASVKEIGAALGRSRVAVIHHLYNHRDSLGYVQRSKTSWQERKAVVTKIAELKKAGFLWKEIQEQMPKLTMWQLQTFWRNGKVRPMESMLEKDKLPVTAGELRTLGARIRKLRLQGLKWRDIGLRIPHYSVNRLRSLYIQANREGDVQMKPGRAPRSGRPSSEIDIQKIIDYKARGFTWVTIQAHMAEWSAATLQRAWAARKAEAGVEDHELTKDDVKQIDKYRKDGMMWKEIQGLMPTWSEIQLGKAYRRAIRTGVIEG